MPITCVDICKKVFYKKHLFAVFVEDDVKTGFEVALLALVEHMFCTFLLSDGFGLQRLVTGASAVDLCLLLVYTESFINIQHLQQHS